MMSDELDRCRALLVRHFAEHGTLPSMSGLAELWGFASKSSAARRVDALIRGDIVQWSSDRRLRPGARFITDASRIERPDDPPASFVRDEAKLPPDPVDQALDSWQQGYEPGLIRAYAMTVRLFRLVRSIELELARSAAREGLNAGEVLVLDALFRAGPPHRIAPTDLKQLFLISLAGVAKRVERLHVLGLIDRVPNPEDGRGLLVELNERGIALLKAMAAHDRDAPHIIWPLSLSPNDYETVMRAIKLGQAEIERTVSRDK